MKTLALRHFSKHTYAVAIATFLLAASVLPASAQSWYPNVPDFYQHQNFDVDKDWEKGEGGWCFRVSAINQFFFFKKKGFNGLLSDDVVDPKNWLPASDAAIKQFVADYESDSALQKACRDGGDPLLKDSVNCILDKRGVGPKLGVKKGLIHIVLLQSYDGKEYAVKYRAADGSPKTLKKTSTIFDAMQAYLTTGDSVALYLLHDPTDTVWWNYHEVTVAGVDAKGNGKIWFADPDSNPDQPAAAGKAGQFGNKNQNAGWTPLKEMVACGDGVKRTNLQCIGLRRFVDKNPIPVPKAIPPTQAEIDQRYYEATLQNGKLSFQGNGAEYDRYSVLKCTDAAGTKRYGTCISEADVIGLVDADTKSGKSPAGEDIYDFEVGPGGYGTTPIDEFWLFPAFDGIEMASVSKPGWKVDYYSGMDPFGNDRGTSTWIHVHTDKDGNYNPLLASDVLEMTYETESGQALSAWDIFVRFNEDDSNLRVEAFGANPPERPLQLSSEQ